MQCPKCSSGYRVKSGFTNNRQRYKCKGCGFNYSVALKSTGKPKSMKKQALHLYLEGLDFRSIGRLLGVSNVSVLKWIRSFGKEVAELSPGSQKKTTDGYGLLLIALGKSSSTSLLAIEEKQLQKHFGNQ